MKRAGLKMQRSEEKRREEKRREEKRREEKSESPGRDRREERRAREQNKRDKINRWEEGIERDTEVLSLLYQQLTFSLLVTFACLIVPLGVLSDTVLSFHLSISLSLVYSSLRPSVRSARYTCIDAFARETLVGQVSRVVARARASSRWNIQSPDVIALGRSRSITRNWDLLV